MNRPRVTASHCIEPLTDGGLCDPFVSTTPGVEVSVDFDLHDHEAALRALDAAAAVIRAQIEETRR